MLTTLAVIAVALIPFAATVALLGLSAWAQRRQERIVARQIELTEAIHRELGAVAAPVVRPAAHGAWEASMAVPAGRPEMVGDLVRITNRVLSRAVRASGGRIRIAVTAVPDTEREAA